VRIWGWLYRWRWLVVAAWTVVALAGGVIGGGIYDRTQTVDQLSPDAPSMQADDRLQQLIPEGPVVFAIVRDVDPYAPDVVASTQTVTGELAKWPSVKEVGDLYSSPGGRIGADTRSTLVRVELRPNPSEADVSAVVAKLHEIGRPQGAKPPDGPVGSGARVLVGGQPVAEADFAKQAISDAALGESIALAALALFLIAIVRWGAIAPLAAAVAAVATTLLVLVGLAEVIAVSDYTVNVVTLLGLGLAVDYALLLLWRFREESARSSVEQALAQTMRTAGKAVAVSGAIVAATMAGLAIFAGPLLAAMALGGAVVVVVATVVALTLTPALLAVLAHRLRPITPDTSRTGLLERLAAVAQRRPDTVIIVAVAALILMAMPLAGVNLINSDARTLPAGVESHAAYELYFQDFQHGKPDPVTVVVDTSSGGEAMRDYLNKLNNLPDVAKLELRFGTPPEATIIDLTPTSEEAGVAVARSVRAVDAPAKVLVGGPAAELADYRDSVTSRLPVAVLILVVAIGLLLFLLTRSVLIPVKALLMNLMTLVAALGVLAVVFGWRLDVTTPILLFVFIFGLSTDYEVFLLSRITEAHRAGLPTDQAVREGIARTGSVVTTAAAGLIVVFLGFILGGLTPVREIGVGMAVAIALDVTVLRGLLLPATMILLGRLNWWPNSWASPAASAGHSSS
jgi:putative drug exporter of the RND superfamily